VHPDADTLTRTNLVYREPALYDAMLADSTLADDLRDIAADLDVPLRSALDLGCGTGRLLGELFRRGTTGAGVDLQPGLVAWARREHPALRLEVADLRSVRLDATFDLITCVGNTLAYLHTEADLRAALATAAAHAHPGSLLAVATLTGAGRDTAGSGPVSTVLGPATVTTRSTWHPDEHVLVTERRWEFLDGRTGHDTMRRRSWNVDTIDECARAVGFQAVHGDQPGLTSCARFVP
jgi:SAM-dependent methyltransferase